jgi:hypothetical protein
MKAFWREGCQYPVGPVFLEQDLRLQVPDFAACGPREIKHQCHRRVKASQAPLTPIPNLFLYPTLFPINTISITYRIKYSTLPIPI